MNDSDPTTAPTEGGDQPAQPEVSQPQENNPPLAAEKGAEAEAEAGEAVQPQENYLAAAGSAGAVAPPEHKDEPAEVPPAARGPRSEDTEEGKGAEYNGWLAGWAR